MSHNYRRFIAASCAIVCAASMTGCSDSGYIGTINGMQIPNGIYIYDLQLTAYNEASSKIKEEKGDSLGTARGYGIHRDDRRQAGFRMAQGLRA